MPSLKSLDLKALQNAFQRNVLSGDDEFVPQVVSSVAVPGEERLLIYANAYFSRLEEALESDYEILKQLLGDETFSEVCMAYTHKYPSHYYSLRWFGQDFSKFLGYQADGGEHHWPAEMAKLEWTFIAAFDAADAKSATEADAAAIAADAWPNLKIIFHPSVHTVVFWWNTQDRWRTAKHHQTIPEPVRLSDPGLCLLWRENLLTSYRSVEADEAVCLQAALGGADFSEICGALAEQMRDQVMVPMTAAGFLKGWLAAGMITEFLV